MMERPVSTKELVISKIDYVGVKVPQFSFGNLQGVDPVLGIETASTGQVVCFGKTRADAYMKGMLATGFKLPKENILLSIGSYKHKQEILEHAKKLHEFGYNLFGTKGTAEFLAEHGIPIQELDWSESMDGTGIMEHIASSKIHLFINIPSKTKSRKLQTYVSKGYHSRRLAVDFSVPLITDIKCAKLFIESLRQYRSIDDISLSKFDSRSSHRRIALPGFVGIGIHAHKSDLWKDASAAAVSSGFTSAVVLPSATTPLQTFVEVEKWLKTVSTFSYCDYLLACNVNHASLWNISTMAGIASTKTLALMLSLDEKSTSPFYLPNVSDLLSCFENWPVGLPIIIRAEDKNLAAALLVADVHKRPVHILNVSRKEELLIIQVSKKRGLQVTCSTTVCSLFLNNVEHANLASSLSTPLASPSDVEYLWSHIGLIDCISFDESELYPIGHVVPLLLTAAKEGKLTLEDLVAKLAHNPRKIFGFPTQDEASCEIDLDDDNVLKTDTENFPHNPFAGRLVSGRVRRVTIRGETIYLDGRIVSSNGHGKPIVITPSKAAPASETTTVSATPAASSTESPKLSSALMSPSLRKSVLAKKTETVHKEEIPLPFDLMATDKRNISLEGQSILSVKQFDRNILQYVFDQAHEMRKMVERVGYFDLLKGRVLCALFYEPSTRTSSSFIAAMERLGGSVVAINSVKDSSVSKGETLADTIRTMEAYVDVIVLRHPEKGAAKLAAKYARKPVINAGDGVGEHPTQALLDTFTIREELGTLNGLTVTMLGDLKHGRTVHSLSQLLSLYDVKLIYVSPESLSMPAEIMAEVGAHGVSQRVVTSLDEVLPETDVLYVTRVQKERFATEEEYNQVKGAYKITPELLTRAKENMIIMHPLPRVDEITPEVDSDPRAAYFRQMQYGMYVRMSLLAMVLGKA